MEHKKKKKHDCASKVKSEEYGIGYCIPEQHTMLEDGTVTHYDVEFDEYVVENVPVSELEIIEESMHEHYDNDEKNAQIDEFYSEHMCAKHVLHPEFGEGYVLEGQHSIPDADGNIAWYNVEFDHGIETIQTEDVKIMHESHHGHMMKKKKKMKEEVTENFVENFVDNIINDKSTAAKESFMNAISQKISNSLADKKIEMAQSTFATEGAMKSMVTDKMTSGKGMSFNKAVKAAEKDLKAGKNLPKTRLNPKEMKEASPMVKKAGSGQTSAY